MRILIAGLGAIGQRHARNLRAICGDDLELLAFRRRRLPHVITESLARDDSRDAETDLNATAFADLDEALATRPEAVFVCTPSSQHLEIAQRAASSGCHLFIEKPVSHTLDGVARLQETVVSKRLTVLVGCQWRYHPCVRWLREALQTQALGRIVSAEIEYSEYLPDWHPYEDYRASYAARADLGGGVVLTQIHDYDLAWWLFGPLRSATATGGHLSGLEIDVEDTVHARLEGPEVSVCVRQSFASRQARRVVRVRGERGSATIDLLEARITADSPIAPSMTFPDYQRNQMFIDEARHFLACLDQRETPVVPLEDGVAVLRVAIAVKDAVLTRRTVPIT